MSNRGQDEVVWALSEQDGKEAWAVRIAPAHSQNFPQSKEDRVPPRPWMATDYLAAVVIPKALPVNAVLLPLRA
jgi:hypothetical protein